MHVPWTGTQLRDSMHEASPPSFSLASLFFSLSFPVSLVLPCSLGFPQTYHPSAATSQMIFGYLLCVCTCEECV